MAKWTLIYALDGKPFFLQGLEAVVVKFFCYEDIMVTQYSFCNSLQHGILDLLSFQVTTVLFKQVGRKVMELDILVVCKLLPYGSDYIKFYNGNFQTRQVSFVSLEMEK